MKKRTAKIFVTAATLLCLASLLMSAGSVLASENGSPRLPAANLSQNAEYNGIVLPTDWPPDSINPLDGDVKTAPYLLTVAEGGYLPEIIDITTGRQLFVDDFLISETNLETKYYKPEKYENNPVFHPETADELTSTQPGAAPISGGIWYDMIDGKFKMWYEAGWNNRLAYAESDDGINWTRPAINADGTNTIVRYQQTDSASVWIDYDTEDETQRYKMFVREPGGALTGATLYASANGKTWKKIGTTGDLGDRSTIFYNPFRQVWGISIRDNETVKNNGITLKQRARFYHEGKTLLEAADYSLDTDAVFWLKTDSGDKPDYSVSLNTPQLYNFDTVAYESIMVGMFQIWYGPENDVAQSTGKPKITELQVSYSRDGFHYDRPMREAFISATRNYGDWDYGYVQSISGGMIINDDKIYFYYTGFSGQYNNGTEVVTGMHVGSSVGLATLRRDGFASVGGNGSLTTNTLTVNKAVNRLFVNTDADAGSLKAEILTPDGKVLEGYSANDCVAVKTDSCKTEIKWNNSESLDFLEGSAFKIKFYLENAELYSFWLSDNAEGDSDGMTAAGEVGRLISDSDDTEDTTGSATGTEAPTGSETTPADDNGCGGCGGMSAMIPAMLCLAVLLPVIRKNRRLL